MSLTNLDLSCNQLQEGEEVLEVLKKVPKLGVLYLKGNPLVPKVRHYRKTVLSQVSLSIIL